MGLKQVPFYLDENKKAGKSFSVPNFWDLVSPCEMKHRTDRQHSSWEVTKTVRTEVDGPERQERALSLEMGRRDLRWDRKLRTGHVGAGSIQCSSTNTGRVRPTLHKQTGKTFQALAIKRRILDTQRPPSEEVVLGVLFCFSMITCSMIFKVFSYGLSFK